MTRLIRIAAFCGILLTAAHAQTQTRHNFTAKDCIAYAKKSNPAVRIARLNVDIQRETNRQITASALPGINAYGAYTNNVKIATQLIPAEFAGGPPGTFLPIQFGTKHLATGGINLQQVLFDGQVFTGLKARSTVIDLQEKVVDLTEEIVDANIYKIYYQLAASRTQIDLLDSNIARLQKLLSDTKIIYENGFAEQVDVNKATVQLTNLQTQKVNVVNQIEGGYLGLKLLIGMPAKDTLTLIEEVNDEKIKNAAITDSNYRYEDRKEYQLLQLTKKLRDYNIQRYKLAAIPTLALNGTYSYTGFGNKFSTLTKFGESYFPAGSVGLRLDIPIFNGFRRRSQVAQAKIEKQQTLVSIDSTVLAIDQQVAQAKLSYATAITSLNAQRSNIELATLVYEQTKKKYEIGTGNQTEINAAQGDLQTAQTNYINAIYNAITARVDYLKAIGRLDQMGQ